MVGAGDVVATRAGGALALYETRSGPATGHEVIGLGFVWCLALALALVALWRSR